MRTLILLLLTAAAFAQAERRDNSFSISLWPDLSHNECRRWLLTNRLGVRNTFAGPTMCHNETGGLPYMNARGAAILLNPHPCGHIVYPYTDEGLVGQAVSLFASSGIRDGEGVVLIMTSDHCESIKLRLQLEGINAEVFEQSGQLICVTTEELLAKFLHNGVLDEEQFRSTISGHIAGVRESAGNGQRVRVRVFGEMVSQLRSKDLRTTTRLEELWNEVIEEHSVSLLCTYALVDGDDCIPEALVSLHGHNIQREPVS